jgi:hypothetical protein
VLETDDALLEMLDRVVFASREGPAQCFAKGSPETQEKNASNLQGPVTPGIFA